jgi:hypothetical protein
MIEIDFDRINLWAQSLSARLLPHLSDQIVNRLRNAAPEYVEDALDVVFECGEKGTIVAEAIEWISGNFVVAYHGSRLSKSEISSVLSSGIKALSLSDRSDSLRHKLKGHQLWPTVEGRFSSVIQEYGNGRYGRREGQAHLTISRGALTYDFNHYLKAGSEFDQVVTLDILGREAQQLLKVDRTPVIFRVIVPGSRALDASSRWLPDGEISSLVRYFLQYWAYWLFDSSIDTSSEMVDCGIIFYEDVPASWIADVIALTDLDLEQRE